MAIYHFSAQVIGRKAGRSAVSAAAYRSASRLRDDRLEQTHDFRAKSGVVHSEVMLPDGVSVEWADRERLWNDVEAAELRRDAQLAREIEVAIPREITPAQGIDLVRTFVTQEFVDRGMIADVNVHWDNPDNPHAHIMLTMRETGVDENGDPTFGQKVRAWNEHALIDHWREAWAVHANERLAELDIDARIDHRSLAAQGIALEPQSVIGAAAQRMERQGLLADRAEMHREIARENGARILGNPALALDAITHQQSTFTRQDLGRFVHRHSDGLDQFNAVMSAVRGHENLVAIGKDSFGNDRFTSRAMIAAEQRLHRMADMMATREHHGVRDAQRDAALARAEARGLILSAEQRDALAHVTQERDLGIVIGTAGAGKSAMLGVAREAWEAAGYAVRGAALSGIAAENLAAGSGIESRTIASLEHGWAKRADLLTTRDVLVVDEAGMVGTRTMESLVAHAAEVGAKLVLVGDPQQLQAIEAGAAFRSLHERHGGAEIATVRRQVEDWQRDATRELSQCHGAAAIDAYADHGMVHAAASREAARAELIDRWDKARVTSPDASRIILTHTNDEVRALNLAARERLRATADLGQDVHLTVERGERDFAGGDRVMFLKNERGLGVKNGSVGTIDRVDPGAMAVRLDDGRAVNFDLKDYAYIDHGYAATIHKAQGMTVDRVHVLATPCMDAHSSYVALSRHRDRVDLHYGRDDFATGRELARTLSRDRAKDMASDYAATDPARDFAERRGLTLRERVVAIVRKVVPEKMRDLFDGLLPVGGEAPAASKARGPIREKEIGAKRQIAQPALDPTDSNGARPQPQSRPARSMFDGLRLDTPAPCLARALAAPDVATSNQPAAARDRAQLFPVLQRHAKALEAIWKMEERGLAKLPHQQVEFDKACTALDQVAPQIRRDWEQACVHDPSLASEMAQGDNRRVIRAVQLEAEVRTTPALRADRFVTRWQQFERLGRDARARGDAATDQQAERSMRTMLDGLHRDPQLESVLEGRRRQLGIAIEDDITMPGAGVAHDLGDSLGRALRRSLGINL